MIFLYAILVFIIGFIFGWGARSFQFVVDEDCANPEHNDKENPKLNE